MFQEHIQEMNKNITVFHNKINTNFAEKKTQSIVLRVK